MILAREGLEQWIMESKWKSKGGKMRREWSEKKLGPESELLEFSAMESSV